MRFTVLYRLLCVAVCCLLAFVPEQVQAQTNPDFSIELVVPVSNPQGERLIQIDRYPRFHVAIRNISNREQRIWKDWNSWGYFNLYLQMQTAESTIRITRRRPAVWNGDFPDFWVIPPGEFVILEIDMIAAQWNGLPDLYGESLPATLTAVYENKPDVLAEEFRVWTGRLMAKPVQVLFR